MPQNRCSEDGMDEANALRAVASGVLVIGLPPKWVNAWVPLEVATTSEDKARKVLVKRDEEPGWRGSKLAALYLAALYNVSPS